MNDLEERLPIATSDALPQAVVFDLDGVMIDSERIDRLGWYAIAAQRGFTMSDELYARTIGRREGDIGTDFRAHFGRDFDFGSAAVAVRSWREEHVASHGMPEKPGIGELLDFLDLAGIRYAVATSTKRDRALASMGRLANRMTLGAFGDEVAAGKPAPDIYLLAARRLAVDPRRCLAVEDSLPGIAAAQAAGMTVVMVPDLVPPHSGIPYVCTSLHRILEWLRSAGATASLAPKSGVHHG